MPKLDKKSELAQLIGKAANLAEPYKEVLSLYLKEKLTQREIAQQKGITIPKVRELISKGMYMLRKEAQDPEYLKALQILYRK